MARRIQAAQIQYPIQYMEKVNELISKIHASPQQAVVAVAGGGSLAAAWLLSVPGASRTLLESVVPYSRLSMMGLVGQEPEQYVSAETARDMAKACYQRALRLREGNAPVLGLACTATLATDRVKRGDHRCSIAIWDEDQSISCDLTLDKGRRDRAGEEELVSCLLVETLARGMGIESQLPVGLSDSEHPQFQTRSHATPIQQLLTREVASVTVHPDGRMVAAEAVSNPLLPGSFSPLHYGHQELAAVAERELGAPIAYELSVVNVDKPPLEEGEILRRIGQFRGKAKLVLTRAETFHKKAKLFPGVSFVIGWDTALRLVEPRYYEGDYSTMCLALAELGAAGSRFLVAGREDGGSFKTLADVPVPSGFDFLFQGIPESAFRADVTSTELRSRLSG